MADAKLAIGIVGHGFMAEAHSRAWRAVSQVFDLDREPEVVALAGRNADRVAAVAAKLGIARSTDSWRELVDDPAIHVIDVCTPVDSHEEITLAALAAGKHVLCEKPLALDSSSSATVVAAAADARQQGILAMVGYNYRRVPALALAHELLSSGKLGAVRQLRARYLQDWLAPADAPWSWRMDAAQAGAGALADLGSHLIDIASFLIDERVNEVSGAMLTVVASRPVAGKGSEMRPVTVDDACSFLGRCGSGMMCSFEVSRLAHGRKNQLVVEIDTEHGALAFNLERLNELEVISDTDPENLSGFRTVMVTEPVHPYIKNWWPPGHVLGWDDTFVNQVRDFVDGVSSGTSVSPTFEDGHYIQRVIDAVQRSHAERRWCDVGIGARALESDHSSQTKVA